MDKLTRRNIRYICFRIQTEVNGGAKAEKEKEGIMQFVDEVKEHMEEQEDFGGWDKFGKTWDVDDKSPLVAVNRTSSIQTNWNKILKKQAKKLPATPPPSAPLRGPGGKFISKSKQSETPAETPVETPAPPPKPPKKSFWKRLV